MSRHIDGDWLRYELLRNTQISNVDCCQERVEYLHLTGPGSIPGHTQLAVSKPRGLGCDTPSSEPGFSLTEQLSLTDWEEGDEMLSAEHMTAKLGFTK